MQIQRVNNQQSQSFEAKIKFQYVVNKGEVLAKKLSHKEKTRLQIKAGRIGTTGDSIVVRMDKYVTSKPGKVTRGPRLETEAASMKIETVMAGKKSAQNLPRVRTVVEGRSELATQSPFMTISRYLDGLLEQQKTREQARKASVSK